MKSKANAPPELYERGETRLCVFAEEIGLDMQEAYELAEGFGRMGVMPSEGVQYDFECRPRG